MNSRIRNFVKIEAVSGILLFMGAILALVISNTDLYGDYVKLARLPISITMGEFSIDKPLLKWVNDGFMALFFLVLTLEAKFHIVEGKFTDKTSLPLAVVTALGGVLIPALLYFAVTVSNPVHSGGWAIPIATDTAFVLGILSFLSHKVPSNARIFVLGLSIIDDIIAVVVLAIFYTPVLHFIPLLIAGMLIILLGILNFFKVGKLSGYVCLGLCLWISLIECGIHGTLAGVLTGLFIPAQTAEGKHYTQSPLKRLEHILHPFVAFIVLPLFAFLNTEIPFREISLNDVYSLVSVGIIAGLFLGKQTGIMISAYIYTRLKKCRLPEGLSWSKFWGISILCGVGFTFSLFIGLLSFDDPCLVNQAKIGIIIGSLLSAIIGTVILIKSSSLPSAAKEKLP